MYYKDLYEIFCNLIKNYVLCIIYYINLCKNVLYGLIRNIL
jgi:hypothetical protein